MDTKANKIGEDGEGSAPGVLEFCRYMTERSPVPALAVEGQTHLVRYVNPAFCRLAGKESEALLGRPFEEAVPEGAKNECLALLDDVLRTGHTATLADQEHTASLPGVYWSYAAWAILEPVDHPIGVMVQVTDTSVEARAREQMREISEALLLFGLQQQELGDALRHREETVALNETLLRSLAEQNERTGAMNVRLRRAIQETHHRVKNNLQTVYALVELQMDADSPTVPTSALQRIGTHVRTLASLHDLLTQQVKNSHPDAQISTTASLARLLPLLQSSIGTRQIRSEVADMKLSLSDSASLSLLISELVSNAVKHGKGDITVTLGREGDEICLAVGDAGKGFPSDFDFHKHAHTGLELALSIAEHDLRGKIEFTSRPQGGASVFVRFPVHALEVDGDTNHLKIHPDCK